MAPSSTQARMGAHRSWARTEDRAARTAPGTAAFLARFEREVDPDGTLPAEERAKRAESARRAHMLGLAAKSARARKNAAGAAHAPGASPTSPVVGPASGDLEVAS